MLEFINFKAQAGFTGFESPAGEYKPKELCLSELLIDDQESAFTCLADGDSMTGDGIFTGDLLIVSKKAIVKDRDIVVGNLNGVFICKRLDIKNRILIASGKNIANYKIRDGDEFQIAGVVTSSVRMHREFKKLYD